MNRHPDRIPEEDVREYGQKQALVRHLREIGEASYKELQMLYHEISGARARMSEIRREYPEIKARTEHTPDGTAYKVFYWEDDPLANADPEDFEQGNLLGEVGAR